MIVNTLAALSLIGIWPRFLEPSWLETSRLPIHLPQLPKAFEGFTCLHLSDLHFASKPSLVLRRTLQQAKKLKPDCILFTGDFLCYAQLHQPEVLQQFLAEFKAPYGCFAVLGNHDYNSYVSLDSRGQSVVLDKKLSLLSRFKNHRSPSNLSGHTKLLELLQKTSFQLLHNETIQITKAGSFLNIAGLGDFFARDVHLDKAFKNWIADFPGLVLCHNPVTAKLLEEYPGDLILSGHTHGSQFNIPLIRDLLLQDKRLRRGLIPIGHKKLFISRGIGSHIHFRLFSRPEITLITLHGQS